MSATAQAQRLATLLGEDGNAAPVVEAPGALHEVDVVWAPPSTPVDPPHGLRVDPRLLTHVAATVRRALAEQTGDVLVFLPGAGEIAAVSARLTDLRDRVDVVSLHGRLASGVQDDVLRPGAGRRVVLATAVAESSLTVPGVRVVVDAGLARVPRMDFARGLGSLVTIRVSQASADQRAGRAGREGPGRVYRCWSERDHERLPAQPDPEVAVADLTAFVLHLAQWGDPDGDGLALLDRPPAAAAQVARTTLMALGAVDSAGRITPRGQDIGAVGAHPRLARALLDAAATLGTRRAAEVVALLSADVRTSTDDIPATLRRLRDAVDPAGTAAWRAEARRLISAVAAAPGSSASLPDDLAAALVVALAFPNASRDCVHPAAGRIS
jgi:ATP-dependent helicase HrpB